MSDRLMSFCTFHEVSPFLTPRFVRGFVSFLSLLLGSLDYSVSVVREYRLVGDRFTAGPQTESRKVLSLVQPQTFQV
jgi:hypothetical protein